MLDVGGVWVVTGSGGKVCLSVFLVNATLSCATSPEFWDSLSESQRLSMSFELVLRHTSLMYLKTKTEINVLIYDRYQWVDFGSVEKLEDHLS